MNKTLHKNTLRVFFTVVIALSLTVDILIDITEQGYLYLVLMWIPAIAAIVAGLYQIKKEDKFSFKRLFELLGFRLCNIKYILLGVLIPLIYLLIPYIIYWYQNLNDFAYTGVPLHLILSDCLPVLVIGIFINLVSAIGEEIGWRGFMVPALAEKYGTKKSLIISSLFWCLWHLPLIITGNYLSNMPILYQLPLFILCIFPVGIICGIYALKTSSVLPSSFLHAAHNNYDQSVFQIITRPSDKLMYFVSETGIYTIVVVWIITIIMVINNKELFNKTK